MLSTARICARCGQPILPDESFVVAEYLQQSHATGSTRPHTVYLPGPPEAFHIACAPINDHEYRILT
ncbi:MAG: hypothetical protein ACXVJ7_15605 [Acidimicrobiia bacterium]